MKIDRVRLIESYRHPTAPTNGIVPFDYICCLAFRMSSKPNSIPQNIEIYIDRFKEETFTLHEPTEEINPNPTSPDTPQISDPVPSSSVNQPRHLLNHVPIHLPAHPPQFTSPAYPSLFTSFFSNSKNCCILQT